MSARMPVDVLVLKGEDEVLADHPAVEPTIFTDGSAEIPVEIWAGNTVFVRFMVCRPRPFGADRRRSRRSVTASINAFNPGEPG